MCKDCKECENVCSQEILVEGRFAGGNFEIERCPIPSKRVEKPNKYREAWEKFKSCAYKYEDYTFEDFEFACREAGLV